MKQHPSHLLLLTAALGLTAGAAQAQNLVVDGSLCVGFDCPAAPAFGFDTIRMQENNLRLHYQDTSTTASFPTNDWRVRINDSANGGGSYYAIEDSTGGRTPFLVEAGARTNALFVESQGDIGFGTSNPATELHMVRGDTPTLRMEQDGSSGFAPQTWDLAGNETNFFIRDVTNGSTLPFRIRPDAPTSSIDIAGDGDVGVGTSSPVGQSQMTIRGDGSDRGVLWVQRSGAAGIVLEDTGATAETWSFGTDDNSTFNVALVGTGILSALDSSGNLTITGEITTTGGTCGGGCDAVFTEEYDLPSIAEHTEQMYALGYLPNVGPTLENQPINVSDKVGRMLNELEHAHIFIAQQQEVIDGLGTHVESLTTRLAVLEDQLQD